MEKLSAIEKSQHRSSKEMGSLTSRWVRWVGSMFHYSHMGGDVIWEMRRNRIDKGG